jgi:hypothetical protein
MVEGPLNELPERLSQLWPGARERFGQKLALREGALIEKLLIYLKTEPIEAIRVLDTAAALPLLHNGRVQQALLEQVSLDATVAPNLDSFVSAFDAPARLREAVGQYLARPGVTKALVKEIRSDIATLLRYPKDILQNPEVRHASLERINAMLAYRVRFSGSAAELRQLLDRHVDALPDLATLVGSAADIRSCDELVRRIILVNPRANQHIGQCMETLPVDYAASMHTIVKTLEVLGIRGVGRFHNARELIVNRYHAGTPDQRKQIDALLGAEPAFTSGGVSLRSDPAADTRPLCIVTICQPDTDLNGALNAKEEVDGRDDIDALTTYYKVVYLEPVGACSAIDEMIRVSQALGRPIDLWFCGGHGSPAGVVLSSQERGATAGDEELSRSHRDQLARLRGVFSEGAQVALLSCATGCADESGPSFAQVLHEAIPSVAVYAPDTDTPGYLAFHSDGRFKAIHFDNARRVAFYPHAERGVIEDGPHGLRDWVGYWLRVFSEHPVLGGVVLGGALVLMKSAYDFTRSAIRQRRSRFQQNMGNKELV